MAESTTTGRAGELRRDAEQYSTRLPSKRLLDIDGTIIKYIERQIIKSGITGEDDQQIKVPVIYAAPELWKSAQADGYLRDTITTKLRVPLLAITRGNVARDRSKIKNLDANQSHIYRYVEKQYTKINTYDRFSVLSNVVPAKRFTTVVIPDYVVIQYNCKIWTDYITHMNQIIEAINYADASYWGENDRYKLYTNVSDFSEIQEVTTTDGRSVRCEFKLTIYAHIIPQNVQKQLNSTKESLSVNSLNITFKEE